MAWTAGTTVVRQQHVMPPDWEAGTGPEGFGPGEGLFSRRGPFQCTAAHAVMVRACLPRTAPGDVGAVHHDMSLDAQRH